MDKNTFELELLHYPPEVEPKSNCPPLLFIHGAFCGAWVWAKTFLPYFAAKGHDCYALSLTGHGHSPGHENLHGLSISDYVADVCAAVEHIGCVPVMVGHSMGGMIIQKYLEENRLPAACLISSVAPEGLAAMSWKLPFADYPKFFEMGVFLNFGKKFISADMVKRTMFSGREPAGDIRHFLRRAQQESRRAILDMSGLDLPKKPACEPPPTLVLWGGDDPFCIADSQQSMAEKYNAKAYCFENLPHALIVDKDWQDVAGYLAKWLEKQHFVKNP